MSVISDFAQPEAAPDFVSEFSGLYGSQRVSGRCHARAIDNSCIRLFLTCLASATLYFSAGRARAAAEDLPDFIVQKGPLIAITHVEVIDGTGGAIRQDQTVFIDHDRIASVGPQRKVRIPPGAVVISGVGKTLIPGLFGMHEHLFYPLPVDGPPVAASMFVTFPPIYLASGVTNARTAGTIEPYTDLAIKERIAAGLIPGPNLDLTAPYLQGKPTLYTQMHVLKDAEDARSLIRYWHNLGFTSAKAYTDITTDELAASIDEAHKLGMKMTGHLCSVGFQQAIELGIDNLEHGPFGAPDGDLEPHRLPGVCATDTGAGARGIALNVSDNVNAEDAALDDLIRLMVQRRVALTSTLAVLEGGLRQPLDSQTRLRELLHPLAWTRVAELHGKMTGSVMQYERRLKKEMAFERRFFAAGGNLMAGCDPTGNSHTLAGLGDQRNIELLTEAGFSVAQAVRIATLNGAIYENIAGQTGSVEAGKTADLVLLDGRLSKDINVIEKPLIVFKRGMGYDSQAIYQHLAGEVGLH